MVRVAVEPGQWRALAQALGCAGVVFNDGLHARQEARRAGLAYITDAELLSAH
jgi:putative transposase